MNTVAKAYVDSSLKPKKRGFLNTIYTNKSIFIGLIILLVLLVITIFPFLFFDKVTTIKTSMNKLMPPSLEHPFGTDQIGRDILSRVIWGSQASLGISLTAMLIAMIVGGVLGLISGYLGGYLDMLFGRIVDVLYSIPSQILGIFVAGILGPGIKNVILAISIVFVPIFYRTMRGSVLKEKEQEYIDAARVLGMSDFRIMFVHILRNVLVPVTVQFTVGLAVAIQLEAALGFLGLGLQPPASSWGSILNDGIDYLLSAPWISVLPGLCMVLAVLAFNLLGDGIRDLFDPQNDK